MKQYGKLTKSVINIIAFIFIITSFGCSAIRGNEADTEQKTEAGSIISEVHAAEETVVTEPENAEDEAAIEEIKEDICHYSDSASRFLEHTVQRFCG